MCAVKVLVVSGRVAVFLADVATSHELGNFTASSGES